MYYDKLKASFEWMEEMMDTVHGDHFKDDSNEGENLIANFIDAAEASCYKYFIAPVMDKLKAYEGETKQVARFLSL